MIKNSFLCIFLFMGVLINAQNNSEDFRSEKIRVVKDTVQIDSVSINPLKFRLLDAKQKPVHFSEYQVNYTEAFLIIDSKKYREITVEYYRFPKFLTKVYSPFDKRLIVPNTTNTGKLYSLTTNKKPSDIKLFDGLKTSGYITRGLTTGNNQNAVTNSAMDLTIEGKLSKDVAIRANIFDTNIPLQENGYSQNITDFDRIFIELYSKNWRIKAGDVNLKNEDSHFLNFEKQVAGLEVAAIIAENARVSASGAVVRGRFSAFNFVGIESNQGPYKVVGPNNEPAIVIIAGSDRVYVNGIQIRRGGNKDYTIDYNLAEISFNTTYPITNDMRIRIEFQYSDINYTRFITYEKGHYKSDIFSVKGYFYSENDAKNQPVQLSLTEAQKQILANAGNNRELMVAESAFIDAFSENRILYKKVTVGTTEIFEYTTDENDELYTVTFTNVGTNNGDYILDRTIAIGTIFSYVGSNMGNYDPIVQLFAPTALQVAVANARYSPNAKTVINAEAAVSNNDLNLFSDIDDDQNKGLATKIRWTQIVSDKKWQLLSDVNYQFIHRNFRTVQRFQPVEFNRDWNLVNPTGNQQQIATQISLHDKKKNTLSYSFNHLSFSDNFNGSKHEFNSKIKLDSTRFYINSSMLNNTSDIRDDRFIRIKAAAEQHFSKSWMGGFFNFESNAGRNRNTSDFINTSHRFKEYEGYFGLGDTAKVYAKLGFNYRDNDSIRSNNFTEINHRKTFYINSRIVQNKNATLNVFANYRITKNAFAEDEKSLHSKWIYHQRLFGNFLNFGTVYETSSGNIPRQDYIYVETEPGQGYYTWRDYNNDGIKDFDEFEIAEFQDQANYLRVPLPNLRYIATQRAKWSQSLTLNAGRRSTASGFKKILSHFQNQTFLNVVNEQERTGNTFHLNPFDFNDRTLIGLNLHFRNSFYFNRNLRKYSTVYTYGSSRAKQQFFIGNQRIKTKLHQIEFAHKIGTYWLLDVMGKTSENNLETDNFNTRNYEIKAHEVQPKISYLHSKNQRFSVYYHYTYKQNQLQDFEELKQQKFGLEYVFTGKKQQQLNANFTAFFNIFNGNPNSPVGYQMLEGLQNGKNYTWDILYNQKLNSFLNISLNYLGRKSENSDTIHTGSIQLRAVF
ncbi:MAG: hypothetical protein GKR88_08525 [Flavobacteriaceae bacterium]|nr:MAG: hypothetical protein GKR88_08525 [Flavobacteriaceae bacterium]